VSGVIDSKLPKPLAEPTIFVRAGDGVVAGSIGILLIIFGWARRKNRIEQGGKPRQSAP